MYKPIIFSGDMVKAILEGRKSQTRRVIKPQPTEGFNGYWLTVVKGHHYSVAAPFDINNSDGTDMHPWNPVQFIERCTPCRVRDVLWVRESFCPNYFDDYSPAYKADYDKERIGDVVPEPKWKPSIHMPRAAARIFLRVTDVRVERVREISEVDAVVEGFTSRGLSTLPSLEFKHYWDTLNAKRGCGWDTNPWVWVISFERVDKPEGWPLVDGGKWKY